MLRLSILPEMDELVLEWDPVCAEGKGTDGSSIVVESDENGRACRVRICGIQNTWLTNTRLSPMVTCGPERCGPVIGKDGSRVYVLLTQPTCTRNPIFTPE